MGWASGNELADDLYLSVRKFIKKENRKIIATLFYNKFCEYDADDWNGTSLIEKDMEED